MRTIEAIEAASLDDVTGGVARLTSRVNNTATLDAVTQLKSDVESLVTANANKSDPSATMLPMMMMMMRR